jgi:Flp pilus assembly protein CpaB
LISLRGKGRFILTGAHTEVPESDTNLTRRSDWPVSFVAADPVQPARKDGNSTETELASLLKRLYPQASIEVISVRDSVIVRGTVADAEHVQQIREIAGQFAPTVHNQLKVAGALQAGMIPAGYRVLSVPIEETHKLAGMLRAGDRVDVLVTFQRRDARGVMQTKTVTLLENAEVFAPDARAGERDRMALVSLLVRPEEVNAIKLAQSRGNLSLAWRQPQQEAASQLNASAVQELEGSDGTRSVPKGSTVEVPGEDAAVRPASNLQQIRDDLRALHDDVRRLIEIIERRNKGEPAVTSQVTPAPAATDQAKDKLVGLFFMADWCGPCRQMAPLVTRMREQHGCQIRTIDVDVERDLAQIFSIHSLPTVVVLDDGREVDRIVGLTTEDRLKQAFSRRADTSAKHGQSSTGDLAWDMLGMKLSAASQNQLGAETPFHGGLKVTVLHPDRPAIRGSICPGDILVGLHIWETATLDHVNFVLAHRDLSQFLPLKFYVVRQGEVLTGHLNLDFVSDSRRWDPAASTIEPVTVEAPAARELAPNNARPI